MRRKELVFILLASFGLFFCQHVQCQTATPKVATATNTPTQTPTPAVTITPTGTPVTGHNQYNQRTGNLYIEPWPIQIIPSGADLELAAKEFWGAKIYATGAGGAKFYDSETPVGSGFYQITANAAGEFGDFWCAPRYISSGTVYMDIIGTATANIMYR